ncbi:hypothetical protein ABK040_001277 [Willaertia magna]
MLNNNTNCTNNNNIHLEEEEDEHLVLSNDGTGKFFYNRSLCPEKLQLQQELLEKHEGANGVTITSSGIQSISALLHGIIHSLKNSKTINLIYTNELYCDSPRLFKYLQNMYSNLQLHIIDIVNTKSIEELFMSDKLKNQDNILFFETCSNPNGNLFDVTLIDKLKKQSKKLITIVDNTWLTHVICNPFQLSNHIDFVITSLTKYYSAGHCIAGAIISKEKFQGKIMKRVVDWMIINGNHVSPYHCEIILKNMKNLKERIGKASQLTKQVVSYLKGHEKVHGVYHPICEDHATFGLVKRYFNNNDYVPSCFTFRVKGTKVDVLKVLTSVKILEHKTSFGAKMSRTDPWPKEEDGFTIVRLAVGYGDNIDRITQGLDEILSKLE